MLFKKKPEKEIEKTCQGCEEIDALNQLKETQKILKKLNQEWVDTQKIELGYVPSSSHSFPVERNNSFIDKMSNERCWIESIVEYYNDVLIPHKDESNRIFKWISDRQILVAKIEEAKMKISELKNILGLE